MTWNPRECNWKFKGKWRDSSPWHHNINKWLLCAVWKIVILLYYKVIVPPCQHLPWFMFFFPSVFFSWGVHVIPVFPVTTRWIVCQSLKESLQDCALTKRVFQGLKISTGEPLCACQFLICLFIFVSVGLSWEEHSTKSEKSRLNEKSNFALWDWM